MKNCPDRTEAEALLAWAEAQNPGPWVRHSRSVARAAEAIAARCGLDAEVAYVCGLLHDIGRYEGVRGLHHIVAGRDLLAAKGWTLPARICLTHSFPYPNLNAFSGAMDCTPGEVALIRAAVEQAEFDDCDGLIQLCDALGSATGIGTIESRLMDVARRHGVNEYTQRRWAAFFRLKDKFDALCGQNLYALFADEIMAGLMSR